jgi:asparagine synthase (glutamine-hydrolysing)
MCGIVGVLGKLPSQKTIEQARDKMQHRGPDDCGIYYAPEEKVALGHRRLSIIDLSADGRQPFFSDDDRYVIIFNGEIYNYLEIKQELNKFYNFKTKTDTEVLLAAYIQWGEKCLDKFNGMFAIAIWDRKDKKLFCARDRLGIKPFFYSMQNNNLLFASEIKALVELGIKQEVNEDIIFDYLYHGFYEHDEAMFYKDVQVLPAGHFFIWQNNKIETKKYWDLADKEQDYSHLSIEQVKEKFQALLIDSIKLRFRSDVPVGIYLSSGLDSNALLYFAEQNVKKDINTISMCLPNKEYNECLYIDEYLSASQKKNWHTCSLSLENTLPLVEGMNMIQDQPFGGIPTVMFGELNKATKNKKIPVMLHGQGVDEILAGYKYYYPEYLRDQGQVNVDSAMDLSQDKTKLIDKTILDKDFVKQHESRELKFKKPFKSHLLNAQYRDIMYTKIPRTLRFADHASMAQSIELRVPYLDHRIVEFCFWLPAKYKINKDIQKVLIRELVSDCLPDTIGQRQKKSYGQSQVQLFREHYKEYVLALLDAELFKSLKYWDHDQLRKKVKAFFNGEGDNSFFLWQCINLDLWFKKFINKF